MKRCLINKKKALAYDDLVFYLKNFHPRIWQEYKGIMRVDAYLKAMAKKFSNSYKKNKKRNKNL